MRGVPSRDPGPAAPARGVGVGRWRRLVDGVGALEGHRWWDLPGDVVLSIDEAAFRGTDLCIAMAWLTGPRLRARSARATGFAAGTALAGRCC